MAMIALKRIIKGGFLNFRRGGIVSWAAILVVTITLCVITFIVESNVAKQRTDNIAYQLERVA